MSEFLDTPELQDKVIVRLVDDDKDFLRSMKLMLEMMGWKVRDFSLAQDFLQEENFKVPGCIVLDMRMPGMTGFEVTKKLKTEFATSHIPIILLTALTSPDKHLEGLEAGADVYVAKPFSFKLLLAQVFRLIEQCEKLLRITLLFSPIAFFKSRIRSFCLFIAACISFINVFISFCS